MSEILGRIDYRIEELGTTRRAVSLRAGLGAEYIRDMARKKTASPSVSVLEKLAPALETTVEWLRTGGAPARSVIPVVGRVSGGGAIETEWENQTEPLFEIELPFPLGEDAIGFQITGESMWPKYDPDDVIVVSRHGEPLDGLLGFEAVVRTGARDEPGSRYFKRIIRAGTPGLFDLESYNAPPMRNRQVGWAAGLIARVPASRWRRLNGAAVKAAVKKAKKASK